MLLIFFLFPIGMILEDTLSHKIYGTRTWTVISFFGTIIMYGIVIVFGGASLILLTLGYDAFASMFLN